MIALACKACGAPLRVTEQSDLFACQHCGTTHQVQRAGGVVSIHRLGEQLDTLKTGIDRHTAELAVARLRGELDELESNLERARFRHVTAQGAQHKARSGCGCMLVLSIAIAAFAISLLQSRDGEDASPSGCFIFAGVVCLIGAVTNLIRYLAMGSAVRATNLDCAQHVAAVKAKQAEYDRYYAIVSGG